jgi:hypothetical protein
MHIHVGHNMPGYLPESDVMCFSEISGALEALRHELKDQQDYYYEQCWTLEPHGDGDCEWHSVAMDVEAALAAITDGDAAYCLTKGQTPRLFGIRLSPSEGADMAYWAEVIPEDVESCEIHAEQEA